MVSVGGTGMRGRAGMATRIFTAVFLVSVFLVCILFSYYIYAVYDKNKIEELGLLKMDFLGLRTLTVIDDCVKMINKNGTDFNENNI